jgi:acyl transferase domain-containing protein
MSEAPESGAAGIAIVGMAGRFPGAADIERFWDNLKAGVESVTFFSREELIAAGVEPRLLDDPDYVPARAVLDDPDRFDAPLFGFSPREAEVLDPQHRLLLECAWEALEHAGYDPRRYAGLIGVYAGAGPNAYLLFNLIHNRDVLGAVGQFQAMLGNGGDFLATRLSYKLGLRGPSLTVQTACSTSLVAVHLAAQSLLNGECDMALAGGVRVSVPQRAGYLFQPDGILSPDGHCRPFDEEARGAIDGDGAGMVVLKRLDDALADGDRIHAVILGTAINNDGSGKVGYTAPGVDGQAGAIAMAQALAAVHPETVGLIEGHGTGTPLGDPVEVAALRQVFEAATARRRFCALGSVKGNVGHLDAAAGVTSLIKAALALEREVIPPTLHFQRPNARLGLDDSPFFVNAGPLSWPSGPEPRRAGVSSFGMGGTNAHVVLEEAPPVAAGDPSSHPAQLLVLSAATAPALEEMTDRLAKWLDRHPDLDLADVAFTLQVGRQVLPHRRALVCRDVDEAREALRSRRARSRAQEPESRPVAFLGDGEGETARTWREWGIVPDVVLEEGQDLAAVLERPGAVLVDLGTGALAERARSHPLYGEGHVVVSSGDMLDALAELWLAGVEVDWRGFHRGGRRLRVALPAYPFERRRYWIESPHPLAPAPPPPPRPPRERGKRGGSGRGGGRWRPSPGEGGWGGGRGDGGEDLFSPATPVYTFYRPAQRPGAPPRLLLPGAPRHRSGRRLRQLLRDRRPLAARAPAHRPHAERAGGRDPAGGAVPGRDRGRPRGAGGADRGREGCHLRYPPRPPRWEPAALLRPGAALVPRPDGSRNTRLQPQPGGPPHRRPGRARARRRPL